MATAPAIFTIFADILQHIVEESNPGIFDVNDIKTFDHYLDDFFAGHPDRQTAEIQFEKLYNLLDFIGIPTSEDKVTKPCQLIVILGFLLDTLTQTVSIPLEKIEKYLYEIDLLLANKNHYYCTINLLDRIDGKLRHCACAMYGGAAFVRGIESRKHFMKYHKGKGDHDKFKLGPRAAYDLEFWREVLPKMTNKTPFWYILKDKMDYDIILYTDACESPYKNAYGGLDTFGNWFSENFMDTKFVQFINSGVKLINVMELLAVVVAIDINKKSYAKKSLLIRCDNEAALNWIVSQRASFGAITEKFVNTCLKYLFRILIDYKIYISAKRIASEDNVFADNLSRLHPEPFHDIQWDLIGYTPNKNPTSTSNTINKILTQFAIEHNL